jgi:peptidyl-prolyl cis-trans isomerase A (cyclophilin A)
MCICACAAARREETAAVTPLSRRGSHWLSPAAAGRDLLLADASDTIDPIHVRGNRVNGARERKKESLIRLVINAAAGVVLIIAASAACRPAGAQDAGLRNPAALTEQAPAMFDAAFDTSKGRFVMQVHREWAPVGADRFYNLVKSGYFAEVRFFRVVAGQLAQFGMHGDPAVEAAWRDAAVKDDPVLHGNTRGTVAFASRGPDTRTTQLFISLRDNSAYDRLGFAPFAEVVSGMDVVDSLYAGDQERPVQGLIDAEGNAYLAREFPNLDYIKTAAILSN